MRPDKRNGRRRPRRWRRALVRLALLFSVCAVLAGWGGCEMFLMPGASHRGPLPPLTAEETLLRSELEAHVERLAGEIGPRSFGLYDDLCAAADYIETTLRAQGHEPRRQGYDVDGRTCDNLEVEIRGARRAEEVVVIGAHYDTIPVSAGANDNTSGVAALLSLAARFRGSEPQRTLRFVAFVNEEPPYFQTDRMGSRVYARACAERGDDVVAMLALETIGYYSDEEGSQSYPVPIASFYPTVGNFVAFVGNFRSRRLVKRCVGSFRSHTAFPCEGGALWGELPGVGWSDHWSFWQEGFPAVMVTDTAPFRYPHYHSAADTPDKIHYDRLARVVRGLERTIEGLVD